MKLRAFDLREPVPELNEPHAFAVVIPWIDAGSGGSLTLSCLGDIMGGTELGGLRRPVPFLLFWESQIRKEKGER